MSHANAPPEGDSRSVILARAIALFAASGYAGTSMRDVATAVGMSAAALYHHFPDKQALYLAAVSRAFAGIDEGLREAMAGELPPTERLQRLIARLTGLLADSPELQKLLTRELVDADEERLALLAEHIFRAPHAAIVQLARELSTDLDPYLLANSVVGLVVYGLLTTRLRQHLVGGRSSHEEPTVIAAHVTSLLSRAFPA